MSSCAASCSTCCRPVSCASATSGSSPTATALRACLCAFGFSAAQRRWLLRQHHRPSIGLTRSGTARSAAQPCASSNGSPLRNSCFALHLNQISAQHEDLSTPSASARASARLRILCPNDPGLRGTLSPELANDTLLCYFTAPSHHQSGKFHSAQSVPDPSAPAQAHSKYIGFRGGRLPSSRCIRSAPSESMQLRTVAWRGAPDTALRLHGTNP